ncbi:hypothetical protein QFZ91_004912 [Paraburkholderia sp. JPY419]
MSEVMQQHVKTDAQEPSSERLHSKGREERASSCADQSVRWRRSMLQQALKMVPCAPTLLSDPLLLRGGFDWHSNDVRAVTYDIPNVPS